MHTKSYSTTIGTSPSTPTCASTVTAATSSSRSNEANKSRRDLPSMEDIVNLCKKRGFVHQSSEIYGSITGFYDYGPLGVEMKNNVKRLWWRDMVQRRRDVVGLDSSIISSSSVWKASGHVDGFSDPMVDCKVSKMRYRADTLFWAALKREVDGSTVCYVSVTESVNMHEEATALALKKAKSLGEPKDAKYLPLELVDITEANADIYHNIPSPATGEAGHLTLPREFNLMFHTKVGALADDSAIAYLRPETAQGIFTNFVAVQKCARMKIPFGIAHVGKAFRNEITPRNFIFRSREFEQMELEYFIPPGDDQWRSHHEGWIRTSWDWLLSIGVDEQLMGELVQEKRAHYAKACTDITFRFPFGVQELMGVAARGDYDLNNHAKHSGKNCEYFDDITNVKYIPHVIEPSFGVERVFLALLTSAYRVENITTESKGGKLKTEQRVVLGLHPAIAPVKVGVFPLVSNNPDITAKANQLCDVLTQRYNCEFDTAGAIGRRYRRADEAGTPYCVTVDYTTLEDGTVTVRYRDTMKQERMSLDQLKLFLSREIDGF